MNYEEKTVSSWFVLVAVVLEIGLIIILASLSISGKEINSVWTCIISESVFLVPILITFARGTYRPHMQKIRVRDGILSALIGICLIPIASILSIMTQPWSGDAVSTSLDAFYETPAACILFLFGIFGPATEELFFRGLVLSRYEESGTAKAIFASSALFGMFHMSLNQFSYTFVMGLCFAWLAVKFQNVLPAVIAHMAFNLTEATVLLYPGVSDQIPYLFIGASAVLFIFVMRSRMSFDLALKESKEPITLISVPFVVSCVLLSMIMVLQLLAQFLI
ncbi:MAG: CPBP family intramembrane metalloprotease [Clostridiales bacterium]|nr:CPBP family intramembrane metalloprotease [Clostridiales bacterium]